MTARVCSVNTDCEMVTVAGASWAPTGNLLIGRSSNRAPVSMYGYLLGLCSTAVISYSMLSLFALATRSTLNCCSFSSSDSTDHNSCGNGVSLYSVVTVTTRPLTASMVRACALPLGKLIIRRSLTAIVASRSKVICLPLTADIRPPIRLPAIN